MPALILLVSSDPSARHRTDVLLSEAGHLVASASSLQQAKRLLGTVYPDLVIAAVRLDAFNGLHIALRLPGLEVATVGGGTGLPYARSWLELLGCAGPGKVYRFAQIVAAATLALELSASAAMATAGSENFFRAHHERGGLR